MGGTAGEPLYALYYCRVVVAGYGSRFHFILAME
jgi:hypothetical protein